MNRRTFAKFLSLTAIPIPALALEDGAKWTGTHNVTQEGEWQVHELDFPGSSIDVDYFHIVADSTGDHSYFKMRVRPSSDKPGGILRAPSQEVYDDFLTEPTGPSNGIVSLTPDTTLQMNPHETP